MTWASELQKRHQAMMRFIPREPGEITASDLGKRLREATGGEITQRSLQRDLRKLEESFPGLQCKVRGREHSWSWSKDSPRWNSPGMDLHTALSFRFMESHLTRLLPPAVLKHLQRYFTEARSVLAGHPEGNDAGWQERVRIVTGELPRLAPQIPAGVPEVVYEALFTGRQLEITYQGAGMDRPAGPYLLNPQGLVQSRQVVYLVATAWDYEEVRHFALHRIRWARLLKTPVRRPPDFRLDDHLARGEFEVTLGARPLALRLSVNRAAAFYLGELPLSKDQKIKPEGPDRSVVTATVSDTRALRRWLLGQGEWVTVLGPRELREEMAGILRKALRGYAQRPPRTRKHPVEAGRRPVASGRKAGRLRGVPAGTVLPRIPARIAPPGRIRSGHG